ncbi:MAG: AAA family ATPase [Terriglobales bacterium]
MLSTDRLAPLARLEASLRNVIRTRPFSGAAPRPVADDAVRMALIALVANGHILIEDVPGVGKTTLAQVLARSLDCSLQRIQFTSDLLPSDVTGVSVYNQATREFEFKRGPIFAHILVADEINRTTPKTQSALLEAMNERQVTADGETHPLPAPFLVVATQNPIEHQGTYPLPESQLDRFLLRIRMGYPAVADEKAILRGDAGAERLAQTEAIASGAEVLAWQAAARQVMVDESLLDYALAMARATREHAALALGVSPRGTMMLYRAAQARAWIEGRSFCTPDDFKRLAVPVLAHRVVLKPSVAHWERRSEQSDLLVAQILAEMTVPE